MKYSEIIKLKEMLEKAKIPFEFCKLNGGYQIRYPEHDFVCSAIEHDFSYGREKNLLEIMGLLTKEEEEKDSVLGYLTAEEVFRRIKKHYYKEEDFVKKEEAKKIEVFVVDVGDGSVGIQEEVTLKAELSPNMVEVLKEQKTLKSFEGKLKELVAEYFDAEVRYEVTDSEEIEAEEKYYAERRYENE